MTEQTVETEHGTEQAEPRRPYFKLSRAWVKRELINYLAREELTMRDLADKYGCSVSSIHEFKTRNIASIEAIRADMENEFAGLWIADKRNRVAAYQQDVDQVDDALELIEPHEIAAPSGKGEIPPLPGLMTAKHRALKSVAEELGHLPNRVTIQGEAGVKVNYSIDGVDLGDLK